MKKTIVYMMLLAITMTVNAQSIEPNLKWGKPTDQELNMTEYAADKDADAVVYSLLLLAEVVHTLAGLLGDRFYLAFLDVGEVADKFGDLFVLATGALAVVLSGKWQSEGH